MADDLEDIIKERKWLTLGLARALLGINEATLRQWADNGLVQSFRTPGGHRRFSAEDIYALTENAPRSGGSTRQVSVEAGPTVLPRIRRRVDGARSHIPEWMSSFDEEGQERMRSLGREILELCTHALSHAPGHDAMATARGIGRAYAVETAARGVPLQDAMEAFVFFRNATLEAVKPLLLRRGISPYDLTRSWQQINRLMDEVLLSLTRTHESARRPEA